MPSQLEALINTIAVGPARQQRFIILGDPALEHEFHSYLAAIGKLYYHGHVPTITVSPRSANRMFVKFARKRPGTEACHVASLALKRDGGGLIGKIRAGIRNHLPGFLSGRHRLHIIVAGSREMVKSKQGELSTFLLELERAGYFNLDKARSRNGNSIVDSKRTLYLNGAATLLDLIWFVRRKYGQGVSAPIAASDLAYRSAAPEDDGAKFGVGVYPSINPASGLPLVEGTLQDLAGNTFGFHPSSHEAPGSHPDVNPASGLPMIADTYHDVAGNTYGTNDDTWR